ncbi:hypothetical protein AHAS_Ahas05G0168400 [Arachis hypogaea]
MVLKVRRKPAESVAPAGPTPRELKLLSDIDDQKGLRYHLPLVQFFPYQSSMAGKDPVHVIREALSKALVFYYPLAGRLREGPRGKLMVDCTGEGVLFIEADADVTLDYFGVDPLPPFPCFDELLFDVPFSDDGVINSPLLLIQVTRLKCGGFIFATRVNHTLCDGCGIGQFIKAIAEIAQGSFFVPETHQESHSSTINTNNYHHLTTKLSSSNPPKLPSSLAPKRLMHCAACSLLVLLNLPPPSKSSLHAYGVVIQLHCNGKTLTKRFIPPLPEGYYGNAFVLPTAVSTVEMLCRRPLSYALELVKKAKKEATEEYVHSTADLMVIKGRPAFSMTGSFIVSDITKCGFRDVDYGWGKPLYSGLVRAGIDDISGVSYYVPYTNSRGVHGRVVLISLPEEDAMKRFEKELNEILQIKDEIIGYLT